jgi:hypothetical protein
MNTDHCEHKGCCCPRSPTRHFCSTYCEDAEKNAGAAHPDAYSCGCGHAPCQHGGKSEGSNM